MPKEKENGKGEKIVRDTELLATRIGALLDFYSDRAVAHASFFVASIFGIVTILAIIQQLGDILSVWISIPLFYAFSYMGYYTLTRFGYYADISQRLSEHGLKSVEILEEVHLGNGQTTLGQYIDNLTSRHEALLFPRKVIKKCGKWSKYILAASYWIIIFYLGSMVYSKFWHWIGWNEWFGFFGIIVIVFVLSPCVLAYITESKLMSEQITEEIENDEHVYKLIIHKDVVCSARILPYSLLLKITTTKGEEGKGYGKKLLSHIEKLAKKNGAPTMKTNDIDSCDYKTVCFLKSMGYTFKPIEGNEKFLEATKRL